MARGDGCVYRAGARLGPFKTETDARRALKDLRKEMATGRYLGNESERRTVEDLVKVYRADLERRGCKGLGSFDSHARSVIGALGSLKAAEVTADTVNRARDAWLKERRTPKEEGEEGALRRGAATTDRYLQILRAAYRLAVKERRISIDRVPYIGLMRPENRRTGFVEEELFWKLHGKLPALEAEVSLFAYRCGWRRGEVEGLTWEQINIEAREAWLFNSKNGRRRVLPLEAELWDVIQRRRAARAYESPAGPALSAFVFHRAGKRLGDWRKTWATTCDAVGVPGLVFHDFRRSAVRNFIRSGVPQVVAMEITGHVTRAVFDRYNITTTDEAREAIRATVRRLRPGAEGENRSPSGPKTQEAPAGAGASY